LSHFFHFTAHWRPYHQKFDSPPTEQIWYKE
jgi:hypothetical protein